MTERLSVADAFNPFGGPFVDDPASVFTRAQSEEPIFFSPVLGSWIITRHDDVVAVLRDPQRYSSHEILSIAPLLSPEVAERFGDLIPMEGTLIGLDPPAHTKLRRVMQDVFSPQRIRTLEPQVEALADQLVAGMVDGAGDGRKADLLVDFAFPLPLTVVLRLIGIPDEELARTTEVCRDWNDLSVALLNGVPLDDQLHMADNIVDFHRYVLQLISERERRPSDDLISALVAVRHEENLTDREILSLIPGLVFAGHETTANLLGNGIAHLLGTPGMWSDLCRGDITAPDLVEEALRFDGPVIGLPRIVAQECELNGVQFHAGDRLYVCFWAANRDEGRFADAGEFNPRRKSQPHVGFGRGIHFCIGAPLARLEAAVALRTLSRQLPNLHLATDEAEPTYVPHFFLHGLEHLWVQW